MTEKDPFVRLPLLQQERYQLVKAVATEAVGTTFLARDLQVAGQPLRIIQQLDLRSEDPSLTQFGQTLLLHRAQTIQDIFDNLPQVGTLYSYFADEHFFYVVQAMIRGTAWVRMSLNPSIAVRQQQVLALLNTMLTLMQRVYDQGLASCCLYPNDMVWQPTERQSTWTGMGLFKAITQQIRREVLISAFFPGDSLAYFAPEFLQGRFHCGSDLYTLGMVSIQALLQKPLPTWVYMSAAHPVAATSWSSWLDLPVELVTVLNRMIALDPLQRYRAPLEVLEDLGQLTLAPAER